MNEETPACHGHHETTAAASSTAVAGQFICPMHPEIVEDGPGDCPICGMALEPAMVTADEAPNVELIDMTRRFWIGAALTSVRPLVPIRDYKRPFLTVLC